MKCFNIVVTKNVVISNLTYRLSFRFTKYCIHIKTNLFYKLYYFLKQKNTFKKIVGLWRSVYQNGKYIYIYIRVYIYIP